MHEVLVAERHVRDPLRHPSQQQRLGANSSKLRKRHRAHHSSRAWQPLPGQQQKKWTWAACAGLLLAVLLLSPARALEVDRSMVRSWLLRKMAKTRRETFHTFNPLMYEKPACLAAYVTGPAWVTNRLSVRLDVYDSNATAAVQAQQCLARSVVWRAAVAGIDKLPDSLATTVGYRGLLDTDWQAEVVMPQSAAPVEGLLSPPTPLPSGDVYEADYASEHGTMGGSSSFETIAQCLLNAYSAYRANLSQSGAAAMRNATSCLLKAAGPSAPPSPPPAGGDQGGALGVVRWLRNFLGLAPFALSPVYVGPYLWQHKEEPLVFNFTSSKLGMYQVMPAACAVAFQASFFQGGPMVAQTYPLPANTSLPVANASSSYHVQSAQPQQYDSCYVTQTQVYLFYNGSCGGIILPSTQVDVRVVAEYPDYLACNANLLVKLGSVMQVAVAVFTLPVALFVIIFAAPTVWRIVSWPFRRAYVRALPKSMWRTAVKHRFRMQAGLHRHNRCWGFLRNRRPLSWLVAARKHVAHACVSIQLPNGYSRLLQVFLMAMCTLSVSTVFWRAHTKVVLSSSPTTIGVTLNGPLAGLARYFYVLYVSIGLGFLAYMTLLPNINVPGNRTWGLQCFLAAVSQMYLTALVATQIMQILAFINVLHDMPAYMFLVSAQMINVLGAAILQVVVMARQRSGCVTTCQSFHVHHTSKPSMASPMAEATQEHWVDAQEAAQVSVTLQLAPEAAEAGGKAQTGSLHGQAVCNAGSARSSSGSSTATLTVSATAAVVVPPGQGEPWVAKHGIDPAHATPDVATRPDAVLGDDPCTSEIFPLLSVPHPPGIIIRRSALCQHSGAGMDLVPEPSVSKQQHEQASGATAGAMSKGGSGDRKRTRISSHRELHASHESRGCHRVLKRMYKALSDWVLEEQLVYQDHLTEKVVVVTTFAYPAWFLASMLVAVYMLGYHYIKSLLWVRDLGYCVMTPQTCTFGIVAKWSTTLSLSQLTAITAAANALAGMWDALVTQSQDVADLVNAATLVQTGQPVAHWTAKMVQFGIFFQPNSFQVVQWAQAFGQQLLTMGIVGFTMGAMLGLTTLLCAMASFKAIVKKHRLLKILRRLQRVQRAQACVLEAGVSQALLGSPMAPGAPVGVVMRAGGGLALAASREQRLRPARPNDLPMAGVLMNVHEAAAASMHSSILRCHTAAAPTQDTQGGQLRSHGAAGLPAVSTLAAITTTVAASPMMERPMLPPLLAPMAAPPSLTRLLVQPPSQHRTLRVWSEQREEDEGPAQDGQRGLLVSGGRVWDASKAAESWSCDRTPAPTINTVLSRRTSTLAIATLSRRLRQDQDVGAAEPDSANVVLARDAQEYQSEENRVGLPTMIRAVAGGMAAHERSELKGRALKAEQEHLEEEAAAKELDNLQSLAALRALTAPLGPVVFFIGVLMSATVVQLYVVGVLLSAFMALVATSFFWTDVVRTYYGYVVAVTVVFILNSIVMLRWIGNTYVSDGNKILRPAGWFAFMIIASITNLVLGIFIAVIRLLLLLLTTIFTIGMLDRSILSVRSGLDLPHNAFLAGVHLQNVLTDMSDPALRPGSRGRAVRRWRAAKDAIVLMGLDKWDELELRNRAERKLRPYSSEVSAHPQFENPSAVPDNVLGLPSDHTAVTGASSSSTHHGSSDARGTTKYG